MAKDTINIYINKEERKQLDIVKNKYQLSLTTIVDILCYETFRSFLQNATLRLEELTQTYLYPKGQKTSIKKPKAFKEMDKVFPNEDRYFVPIKTSRFATNALMIYVKKDIKKYIEYPDAIQEYWNRINNKMNTTKDDWWAYNQHIRYERRSLKENHEYYQAELDKINHGKRD